MSNREINTKPLGAVIRRIRIITEETECSLMDALKFLTSQTDNRRFHDRSGNSYKQGYDDGWNDGWNDGAQSIQNHYERKQNDADD